MDIDALKKAGRIASSCLDYAEEHIEVGASMLDIIEYIESYIKKQGAELAFPPQISLNETAAHFYPGKEDVVFQEGDICKADVGVAVDGWIADTARTVVLGENEMKAVVDTALEKVLDVVEPGFEIGKIGKIIEETAKDAGYTPVTNLSGHGVQRYDAHTPPTIPNYDNGNSNVLEEGMVVAIEPFVTDGSGSIYESGGATLYEQVDDRPVRNRIARPIFEDIKQWKGLPFAARWVADSYGWGKTKYGLKTLVDAGVLRAYPPLVEKEKGLVVQAEHTVVVLEDDVVVTTQTLPN